MSKVSFAIEYIKSRYRLLVTDYWLLGGRGIAALLTIIIVSAAVLIMAVGASLLGLGELDSGYTSQKGGEAFAITDGCMEESFRRLRLDSNYSGGSLTTSNGSCIITIVPAGLDRTVTVLGTIGIYNKKLEANISLSTDPRAIITVNSWEEIDSL